MAKQFIYPFTFGDKSKSDLLGGKGANLAEMVQMGLPVPQVLLLQLMPAVST